MIMDKKLETTLDHKVIRKWAEKHGGKPALIKDPRPGSPAIGLKIDFPGKEDDLLLGKVRSPKPVTWKEFFDVFEKKGLAFMYLDSPNIPDLSEAYKFVYRDSKDSIES